MVQRAQLVSGEYIATADGGGFLVLTPGLAFDDVLRQAEANKVLVGRDGFEGYRIGNTVLYFADGKLAEVGN